MCSFVTGKPLIMLHFLLIINLKIGLLLCRLMKGILIFLFAIILKKLKRWYQITLSRKRDLKFQSKPWITSGLQKSIVIKNKLFGKFIKSTNSIIKEKLHSDYKSYRNQFFMMIFKKMEAQVDQHAQYSCRNCLLFHGIKEEKGEDTDSIIINTSRKRWI